MTKNETGDIASLREDDVGVTPTKESLSDGEKVDVDVYGDDIKTDISSLSGPRAVFVDGIRINVDPSVATLADGAEEKRFSWIDFFRFGKKHDRLIVDWDAVATRPSVFDDPVLRSRYAPRSDYENVHRFDPSVRWTFAEERALVRKTDLRLMIWIIIMFLALDIDRGNISQANSASFLKDLHLTTDDFNLGNALAKAGFLIAELPSQLISKKVGPDRWIPTQMSLWSIVAGAQFFIQGRSSFLATRFLVGMLQGGFIPDVILYLSYFYKKSEMSMRLAFFFTCNFSVFIFSGFLGIGFLQLDGVGGHAGWRWLFLLEGLLTLIIGTITFFNLPPSPTQTRAWFRPKGWYSEREESIMVNRILRDDPHKGQMHNRQAISWAMFKESITDYDLWPLYAVGLILQIPVTPVQAYLTLAYRQLGFSTITTNLLSIPNYALAIINLLLLVSASEYLRERSLVSLAQPLWILPCVVALEVLPGGMPWAYFVVTTLFLAQPYVHALIVSWVSMNAGSVRTRTVGSSLYNMFIQISGIIGSYIYQPGDAPLYRKGNRVLIAITVLQIFAFPLIKLYYITRNKHKRAKWDALSPEQQGVYLDTTTEQGSKRLDFQFFH